MRLASLFVLGTALAGCGGSGGGTPASVEATRTLAYAVTERRENADGLQVGVRLQVRRGGGEPITIKESSTSGPLPVLSYPLCRFFGETRRAISRAERALGGRRCTLAADLLVAA